MVRRTLFALMGIIFLSSATVLSTGNAMAQQKTLKEQLVGTWIYVSSTVTRPDGSKSERPGLKGAVIYTADGRFSFLSVRADLPKLASGDPSKPTPEEAMAIASGTVAYFGTYTVDEAQKTVLAQVEMGSLVNIVGVPNQRRIITSITADEMRFTNPRTPAGLTLEFVWRRAK